MAKVVAMLPTAGTWRHFWHLQSLTKDSKNITLINKFNQHAQMMWCSNDAIGMMWHDSRISIEET